MPEDASFFSKIRYISRIYRQVSKKIARENKNEELDTRANLEIVVANLHEDIYNTYKQKKINDLRQTLDGTETRKARGTAIRARMKWQKVGDKCSAEFFKFVRQKNPNVLMTEFKDNHGRIFTRQEDLENICYKFYNKLYQHKEVSWEAIDDVFEDFPGMISHATGEALTRDITERELSTAVTSLAKGKAPRYDGIPVEVFSKLWHTIGHDFHKMILRGIEKGILH